MPSPRAPIESRTYRLRSSLRSRKGFKPGVLPLGDFRAEGLRPKWHHRIHPIKSRSSHMGTFDCHLAARVKRFSIK